MSNNNTIQEIFEQASDALMFTVRKIVKPKYVTGFVYSFFFQSPFPLEPLYLKDSFTKYFYPRGSQLYDSRSKKIILTKEEADYINDKLFPEKLHKHYNELFQALDMFHRHFKDSIDLGYLMNVYNAILIFLDSEEGEYNFSEFNSINDLDINDFKRRTVLQYFNFKETVQEKLNSLSLKAAIMFPSNVFTSVECYNAFKQYQAQYIDSPYNDYSFLFKQMSELNMVHRLTFKDTIGWLSKEGYIDDKTAEDFYIKGSFNTKAKSKERLLRFKMVFEKE